MDNMEADLRRCIEHIKHVHGEIERVEQEVSSVLEKYEKAKAFKAMEQRKTVQMQREIPVIPKPVMKDVTEASEPVRKEDAPTPAPVVKEVKAPPVSEVKKIPVSPVSGVRSDSSDAEFVQKFERVVSHSAKAVQEEKKIEKPVKKDIDFERTVGKVLMGVFASVLVFVSLLVFAIWAVPKFGDTTKMILMYAVSIILAGIGLLLLLKDKENKWFLSVSACGMGALYISFLVTRLHFGVISDLTLYILFFVWGVAVCLLSRLRSRLFLIIGQLGMFISTVLGVFYALQGSSGERLLYIITYLIIAQTVFFVSHYKREFRKNIINLVSLFASICPLAIACAVKVENSAMLGTAAVVIMLCVLMILIILFTLAFRHEEILDGIGLTVSNILCVFMGLFLAHVHFSDISHFVSIVLILIMVGTELVRRLKYNDKVSVATPLDVFIGIMLSILIIEWVCCTNLRTFTGVAPLAIATLLYGYLGERKLYKIFGYVLSVFCVVVPMNGYMYVVQGFLVAATIALMQVICKKQYSTVLKMFTYPIFLAFLLIGYCVIWENKLNLPFEPIVFVVLTIILSIVNVVSSKVKVLYTNLATKEEERWFRLEMGFIHLVLMFFVLIEIVFVKEPMAHGLAVYLGILLFAVNTYEIITCAGVTWGTLITAAKAVFLIFVVLLSYEQTDIVLSVVMLVVSLVLLIIGFALEYFREFNMKPTRIVGLVLTIMSTLKLLLVDIYVDNKLLLAVNLFVGGLICFAISFLYNILDKKISKK